MNHQVNPPFAALTPDCVLNALETAGFSCNGYLLALNSYENRVYLVGVEPGPAVVVKFYRPQRWSDAAILEEHAFVQQLVTAELPVVPPLPLAGGDTVQRFAGYRFAVYPRQAGRAPEFCDYAVLQRMGRLLARIHAVGALSAFQYRPRLDPASYGAQPLQELLAGDFIPAELTGAYRSVAEHALDRVRRGFDRAQPLRELRLHGDCHIGNLLWNDAGPHCVDFDDSRMGPAIQDLWMLLSGERDDMAQQLGHLLAGYRYFFDFDARELQLIEALRTLRLIHHAAWLAQRWSDPAFPAAFPWFGTPRYWQARILELREQIALMDEPPLAPATV